MKDGHPEHATSYLDHMLEYNVPKGKLNRGLTVVDGLKAIKVVHLNKSTTQHLGVCSYLYCLNADCLCFVTL